MNIRQRLPPAAAPTAAAVAARIRRVILRPLLAPLLCCSLVRLSPAGAFRHSTRSSGTAFGPGDIFCSSLAPCGSSRASRFGSAAFAPTSTSILKRRQIDRRRRRLSSARTHSAVAMILESPSAERNKGPIWEVLSTDVFPSLLLLRDDDDSSSAEEQPLVVLEVAAGCGVHTLHFASSYLGGGGGGGDDDDNDNDESAPPPPKREMRWYPTDPDSRSRASIDARVAASALPSSDSPVRRAVVVESASNLMLGEPGATGIRDGGAARLVEDGGTGEEENVALEAMFGKGGGKEKVDLVICINMIHISPWSATLGLMSCASTALKPGGLLYCYGPFKVGGTAVESNLNFDRSLRMRDPSWGVRDLEEVAKVASQNGLEVDRTIEMPANNLSVIFRKK